MSHKSLLQLFRDRFRRVRKDKNLKRRLFWRQLRLENLEERRVLATGTGNTLPTITNILNVVIDEDTQTLPLAFTIGNNETPSSLSVTAVSSNLTLVPNNPANVSWNCVNEACSVIVTPQPNKFGTTKITVTVSDGQDTATDTFSVTVNPVADPPTISDRPDILINKNSSKQVKYTVADADPYETAALTLTATSSDPALIPDTGLVISGTGTTRYVNVIPATNQTGTATVSVTVSDGVFSATDTFDVLVNRPPTVEDIPTQTILEDSGPKTISFWVDDLETPTSNLIVTATWAMGCNRSSAREFCG